MSFSIRKTPWLIFIWWINWRFVFFVDVFLPSRCTWPLKSFHSNEHSFISFDSFVEIEIESDEVTLYYTKLLKVQRCTFFPSVFEEWKTHLVLLPVLGILNVLIGHYYALTRFGLKLLAYGTRVGYPNSVSNESVQRIFVFQRRIYISRLLTAILPMHDV